MAIFTPELSFGFTTVSPLTSDIKGATSDLGNKPDVVARCFLATWRTRMP
jgi:hypothetical protein